MEKGKFEVNNGACSIVVLVVSVLCLLFFYSCKTNPENKKICLQPYKGIEEVYIQECKSAIENYYKCTVHVLPTKDLPKEAYYKPRNRYRADKLIRILRE